MKPRRGATMPGANLVIIPAEGFMSGLPNPRLTIDRIDGMLRVELEHRFTDDEFFIISVKIPPGDQSLKSMQADLFARFYDLWKQSYGRGLPPLLMPIDPIED